MNQTRAIFILVKLCIVCFKFLFIIICLALLTNLYKQALIYEDGHSVMNPEKEAIKSQLEDISERVEEIFEQVDDTSKTDVVDYNNQKIIAWLLNRSKESLSMDRTKFFDRINNELKMEYYQKNQKAPYLATNEDEMTLMTGYD